MRKFERPLLIENRVNENPFCVFCFFQFSYVVYSQALATSIAKSMTMTAQQVVRNENGEEVRPEKKV